MYNNHYHHKLSMDSSTQPAGDSHPLTQEGNLQTASKTPSAFVVERMVSNHESSSEDNDEAQEKEKLTHVFSEELNGGATLNVPLSILAPTLANAVQEGDEHASLDLARHFTTKRTAAGMSAPRLRGFDLMHGGLDERSMERMLPTICKITGLNRDNSCLLYIGAGNNVQGLHAASAHCARTVGIEIDKLSSFLAASALLQHWKNYRDQVLNHRVALINEDVLALRPVEYATHTFFFDLAFSPDMLIRIYEWIAKSNCEYVVSFKFCQEPSYLPLILKMLNAEEVGRVSNSIKWGCGFKCTAVIMRRNFNEGTPSHPSTEPSYKEGIDSNKIASPFLTSDINQTMDCYEKLIRVLSDKLDHDKVLRRSRVVRSPKMDGG
jgi:hypothetical protein